jgi:hypothetical protein
VGAMPSGRRELVWTPGTGEADSRPSATWRMHASYQAVDNFRIKGSVKRLRLLVRTFLTRSRRAQRARVRRSACSRIENPSKAHHTAWAESDRASAAAAEAFFSSLEWEVLSRHQLSDPDHARAVCCPGATTSTTCEGGTAASI